MLYGEVQPMVLRVTNVYLSPEIGGPTKLTDEGESEA